MTKDDYFKIQYKILKFLDQVSKEGGEVDPDFISETRFGIPYEYWQTIIADMFQAGYVSDVNVKKAWGGEVVIFDIEKINITMAGRIYLGENSMMKKVQMALRGIKDVTPFV